jgi:hypothetical protein
MSKHKKMNKILSSAGIVLFAIIITGTAAGSIVLEGGIINVSYAQVLQRSPSTGSEVTTPGQNPVCDPSDSNVNTRESHVCGIPKTPSATGAAAAESPSPISPGANPMCDPTDTSINTTESHVCGIPKTPSATGAAAAEPTTTESPNSITPAPPSGTPEAPIPGLFPIATNSTQ